MIVSGSVSRETKDSLRKHRSKTAQFKESNQDQIYVIESLLDQKQEGNKVYFAKKENSLKELLVTSRNSSAFVCQFFVSLY